MRGTNLYGASSRKYREEPGLFVKFQGSEPVIQASAQQVEKIFKDFGGRNWEFAKDKAHAEDIWLDRKNAHYLGLSLKAGAKGVPTDVW